MIGLSLTAVGLRPLAACLGTFDELRRPLSLDYLELAIGVACDVEAEYGDTPLVLHDSCLWDGVVRHRLDPLAPATWAPYRRFIDSHPVLAVSVHAPSRRRCSLVELQTALDRLEDSLRVPVLVEVMPDPNRWCSSISALAARPLLLDVSHVLIWHRGAEAAAARTCLHILETCDVRGLHLSHNDGRSDSHELIPDRAWFVGYVNGWARERLVTYESLPAEHQPYERLDRLRARQRRSASVPARA